MKNTEGSSAKWYYNPIVVLVLLFFVLGPFGLPLLYKSPKFNKTSKWIITIIVGIYTWYLLYISIGTAKEVFRRIETLVGTFR